MTKSILLLTMILTWMPFSSQAEDFKPSSAVTALMPIVMDNLDTLKLTPKQLDEVRAIARANFSEVEYINAQYHNLKSALKDETLDLSGNKTQSLKLISELAELDRKRMTLTIECVYGLKQILSDVQYDEVIAILEFHG
ncbi:hypothetical protein [Thiomicrorhabdus chilensis]|uniref:hypothetical protein n=1 Tax=Thiomicrorhabdus chilensis TaxID=63656 RepID=UPI000409521B|nr:hypothetical protein [Thiomicrorhabdus chilensis]